jgi:hypothetical protein
MRAFFIGLCILLLSFGSSAAEVAASEQPIVRIQLQPETVAVGEAAELRVTVLGPTWFPKPPVFPSFEVPNAIVRRPPDRSGPISDQVGGERWSGVYRTYQVYPLMGARYTLGGETLQVTVANPGSDPMVTELTVPPVTLTAEVPTGAEDLDPYIAGERFSIRREIDGEHDGLQAGVALVVRYVAELEGLPAIFVPPLAPDLESRTVSVYADTPVLEEGDTSVRTEQVTIVMNYGGDVMLPALSLSWWNRKAGQVEVASIDALTISVAGPVVEDQQVGQRQSVDWRTVLLVLAALAILAFLLRRYLPTVRQRLRDSRQRYLESEAHAFDQLTKACRQQNQGAAYEALLAWELRFSPDTGLQNLAEHYGNKRLQECMEGLSAQLFADSGSGVNLALLAQEATALRDTCLDERRRHKEMQLPRLNPEAAK